MKARNLRIAMLFFCTALSTSFLFQNCAPVSFNPAEPTTALSSTGVDESQPALCDDGQVSGAIRWDLVSGQNIEEPGQCQNGGNLTLIYEKLQKLVCENGKYLSSQEFKKGNLIGQRGGCNCTNGVANGTSLFQTVNNQYITENQSCPANGTLTLTYEKQQKYTCDNGNLVASESYQKGNLIKQEGACLCADGSAQGSVTYKLVLNSTIVEQGLCPYGGNLQYTYEKKQKYVCESSQSVAQNEFIKGNLISTTGACNCEGGLTSGGSKYVTLSGQTISEPATCKYGGNLVNIYEKQERNLCTNGTYGTTGEYQKGAFLRQEGACNPPPVLSETFAVSATTSVRPLDMIWVIDNSGSMAAEAAHVRNNLTNFISALDMASDMKFLLMSRAGTTSTNVSLPSGLDPARFMQVNQYVDSKNGPQLLSERLAAYVTAGTPFFRENSKKIIVFVTDDNSSMSAATFTANLTNVGVASGDSAIFSFIGLGAQASPCQAMTGTVYQSLASQTSSKVYNICDLDWSPHFADLKTDVLKKLGRSFTMTAPTVGSIVKVEVDGVLIDSSKYSFANGVLTLANDVTMTEQSSIKVYYTQE